MSDIKSPKRRKRSPRFAEIAAEAGVSEATVDRVLNERDSVSDATRRKVIAAAARLGVPRHLPEASHALVHLDIIVPRNETPFFQRLMAGLQDGAAMLDRRVIVHRRILPDGDTQAMAEAIATPGYRRAGFIIAAPDRPAIRAAMVQAMARGEAAVAMVTDLPDLLGLRYVGIDNHRAGAVAGHLIGRLTHLPGRVVVMGFWSGFRAHQDRLSGFAEVLAAEAPHLRLEVVEAETRDDPDRCYHATRHALGVGRDVVGIYNCGAGSGGIARALAQYSGPRPTWIGHEATEDHAGYLCAGVMDIAIDQDPLGQAIAALQTLLHACDVTPQAPALPQGELRLFTRYTLA